MRDVAWSRLVDLSDTARRLRRELGRCVGSSKYRDELENELRDAERLRGSLIALLCETASQSLEARRHA